jgi:hypothetical protein
MGDRDGFGMMDLVNDLKKAGKYIVAAIAIVLLTNVVFLAVSNLPQIKIAVPGALVGIFVVLGSLRADPSREKDLAKFTFGTHKSFNALYNTFRLDRILSREVLFFLQMAIVGILVFGLILGIRFLIPHLQYVFSSKFFLKYNLEFSFLIVLFILQFSLRRRILKNQTWKKLSEIWLKFSGIAGLAVGGFGFIGLVPEIKNKLLKITLSSGYANVRLIVLFYIITLMVMLLSRLFVLMGKTTADDENTNIPLSWFVPAFITAWIANIGIYSLLIDSVVLTFHAHLSS